MDFKACNSSRREEYQTSFAHNEQNGYDATPSEPSECETVLRAPKSVVNKDLATCELRSVTQAPDDGVLEAPDVRRDDDIWSSVNEFFDTSYIIFPVVSYVEVASRLIMEPSWEHLPDLRTLLYALRLLNLAARYRMDSKNKTLLQTLIYQVEASRLTFDFAEPSTLDAVVCSLCLFTAYNVLEQHGRAFLYLNEAITLLDAVIPSCRDDEQRKVRIAQVLFNTESATVAIYANKDRRRRVQKPPMMIENYSAEQQELGNDVAAGQVATHLLHCLTWIHLAEGADDVEKVDLQSEAVMETLFGAAVLKQHRYSRIQSADVMVTRQWQLSRRLVASLNDKTAPRDFPESAIASLGVIAMSWICLLREGELRVVGLGKLAGLACNISILNGGAGQQDVLRGLVGAVMREDHEQKFTPPLTGLVTSAAYAIPPFIIGSEGNYMFGTCTSMAVTKRLSDHRKPDQLDSAGEGLMLDDHQLECEGAGLLDETGEIDLLEYFA